MNWSIYFTDIHKELFLQGKMSVNFYKNEEYH